MYQFSLHHVYLLQIITKFYPYLVKKNLNKTRFDLIDIINNN